MADIKDQLIKDSYNYVLQSDLSTGVVYRIGGAIPVNPIFSSGLTINDSFVYSGAGEQNGYALLTDGTGLAYWGAVSGSSGLTYYVSASTPTGVSLINGDRWFDTTTGDETVWINDGVGSGQWVQPNNGGGGGGSPYSGSGISNFLTIWNSTYGLSASTIEYNGSQYIIPSLSSTTIYSENYQGNVVTDIQNGTYISISQNTGSVTINNDKPDLDVTFTVQDGVTVSGVYPNFDITNTDKGSSQYIFKNIKIDGNAQFSSSINDDSLNFSGIGITITSGTNNTLIFSAGTSSQSVSGNYLPLSGGTVTGETIFQSGLTANTVSATTYYNLPVSGLTSGTGIGITNNNNNFTISYTGSTGITGDYLPLSGGTVTGDTIFQSGLTANTISATTYYNLPVSGLTQGNGISVTGSNGNFTISYTGSTGISGDYLPLSGGTLTGGTIFQSGLTANTISATTYYNLPVSGLTSGSNIGLSNNNGNYTVSFTGGSVSSSTNFTNGLTANTISATTITATNYNNLPPLYQLTGGTYSTGTIDFKNTTGGTSFSVTGLTKYFVTGSTPTGVTLIDGDRWFNSTDGVELVYITDINSSQWIQLNNGGTNSGSTSISGNYLPLSGGTVTGNTTFSSGVTLNALTSSEEINNIVADNAGNLYTYTDGVTISAGSDPAVNSGMFKTNRTVDIGGTLYRVYNIKANITVPGANNTFVNYIGVVSGSTNYTLSTTKSLVVAQDPTFNRVQTPLTTYALVYDETLLFAAPVDLMTVNYDNTLGNPDEYYIFSIAANTNNFSCDLQVDYEFLVLETDVITFTN